MLVVLAQFTNHSRAVTQKLNELINEPNYLEDVLSERMHSLIKRGVSLIPEKSDTRDAQMDYLAKNRGNTTATYLVKKLKALAYLFGQRERLHEELTEIFQRLYPNLKFPPFMDEAAVEEFMHEMNLMDDEDHVTFDPKSPIFSELFQKIGTLEANINDEIAQNRKFHELTIPYINEIGKHLHMFLQQRQKNVSL
jgi:hypothetical protein